ncbi:MULTISPECIES: hypothetical protein [unclassified Peribacillus]|uniref:hypothetical protein n=1 Tax=unclassified Peribacillus TaxID=2675266 RepID=UPI0036733751
MTIETSTSSSSTSSSSSTTAPSMEPSSATNTVIQEAFLKQYIANNKPQTAAQIKATGEVKLAEAEAKRIEGESKNKSIVLYIVGIISILLALFGCTIFIVKPDISKDVWVVIGPIITAGMTGTMGFLTGEKQGAAKE